MRNEVFHCFFCLCCESSSLTTHISCSIIVNYILFWRWIDVWTKYIVIDHLVAYCLDFIAWFAVWRIICASFWIEAVWFYPIMMIWYSVTWVQIISYHWTINNLVYNFINSLWWVSLYHRYSSIWYYIRLILHFKILLQYLVGNLSVFIVYLKLF